MGNIESMEKLKNEIAFELNQIMKSSKIKDNTSKVGAIGELFPDKYFELRLLLCLLEEEKSEGV